MFITCTAILSIHDSLISLTSEKDLGLDLYLNTSFSWLYSMVTRPYKTVACYYILSSEK